MGRQRESEALIGMDTTVLLIAAIVFLMIAVIGGGFTFQQFSVAGQVPTWGRALSALIGVVLLAFVACRTTDVLCPLCGCPPSACEIVCVSGSDGPHGLRSSGIAAHAGSNCATAVIDFTLINAGEQPLRVVATYLSSLDPTGAERDFAWSRKNRTIAVGEGLTASHTVPLDRSGTWEVWPCYALDMPGGGQEDVYCAHWPGCTIVKPR